MNIHGNTKHGLAVKDKTLYNRWPVYQSWVNMRQRCRNPNNPDYRFYGGRGITIDQSWDSFAVFYADMGHPPQGYSLDRIDNSGNYTPDNCKWSSRKEQVHNRSTSALVTYQGITKPVARWADEIELDIKPKNLYKRIFTRGWGVERAFTQPLKGK